MTGQQDKAERFLAALAQAGVGTAAVFVTVHPAACERAFEAAAASGLRVVLGKVLMDRNAPAALLEPAEAGIRASLALAERWEGSAGGRLHTAITPRFAPTSTPELLERAGRAARAAGLRVQTHLSEQPDEIAAVKKLFPEASPPVKPASSMISLSSTGVRPKRPCSTSASQWSEAPPRPAPA